MIWKILHMQEKLDALFSDGWLSLCLESHSGIESATFNKERISEYVTTMTIE